METAVPLQNLTNKHLPPQLQIDSVHDFAMVCTLPSAPYPSSKFVSSACIGAKYKQTQSRPSFREWIGLEVWRRSALVDSESNAVDKRNQSLLLSAISALVTGSTNPSVPDLALQSLAGLPSTILPESVPEHLWTRIKSSLSAWFPEHPNFRALGYQPAVAERLCRALLCSPDLERQDVLSVVRFVIRSAPNDHRATALQALLVTKRFGITSVQLASLMKRILDQPSIQTEKLHPLVHHRITHAMTFLDSDWLSFDEDIERHLQRVALNLSPDKPPTLQEEVIFHRLYCGVRIRERRKGNLLPGLMVNICNISFLNCNSKYFYSQENPTIHSSSRSYRTSPAILSLPERVLAIRCTGSF
jgi:hypothetical protein